MSFSCPRAVCHGLPPFPSRSQLNQHTRDQHQAEVLLAEGIRGQLTPPFAVSRSRRTNRSSSAVLPSPLSFPLFYVSSSRFRQPVPLSSTSLQTTLLSYSQRDSQALQNLRHHGTLPPSLSFSSRSLSLFLSPTQRSPSANTESAGGGGQHSPRGWGRV